MFRLLTLRQRITRLRHFDLDRLRHFTRLFAGELTSLRHSLTRNHLSGDLATQYQAQWNNSPSRPTEDYTHLSYIGADEIAKLVVGEIKASSDSDLAGLKNLINPKAKLDGRNPGSITGY